MIVFDIDIGQTLSFAVIVLVPKDKPPKKLEVSTSSVVGKKLDVKKLPQVAEEILGIILSTHSSVYTFRRETVARLVSELLVYENYLKLDKKLKESLKEPKKIISRVKTIEEDFFKSVKVSQPFEKRLEIATLLLTKDEEQVNKLREILGE